MTTYRGPSSKKTRTTAVARSAAARAAGASLIRRNLLSQTGQLEIRDAAGMLSSRVDLLERLSGNPRRIVSATLRARAVARETQSLSFANVYKAAPQARIGVVKSGVEASVVGEIAAGLSTTAGFVIELLGLKRSTVSRKQADADAKLSVEDSEKLVGLARLAGQVEVMVEESGDSAGFDAGKWLTDWLNEPIGALGGQKPAQYMDTNEGQAVVSNLLLQIQHGTYA